MAHQQEEQVEESQSLLTEETPTIMELVKDQESEIPIDNSQVTKPQAEPAEEVYEDWQKEIELGKKEAIQLARQHLQLDSDGSGSTVKASYANALTSTQGETSRREKTAMIKKERKNNTGK